MTSNKKPDAKAGEKKPGKYHYDPVNMAGKGASVNKEQSEKAADQLQSREELEKRD
jgi:hypothetical protein